MNTVLDTTAIRAFTQGNVLNLTGLTLRKLQYWDEQGFIAPSISTRQGRGRRRLYSFGDLLSLRVAAQLRNEGVPLQRIRKVDAHLRNLNYTKPLAELRFWSAGGEVYFHERDTTRAGKHPEQVVASYAIPIAIIVKQLEEEIRRLDSRTPGSIEQRRGVLGGKPVLAGTRIPVNAVLRLLEEGTSATDIRILYPDLKKADIRAVRHEMEAKQRPRGEAGGRAS